MKMNKKITHRLHEKVGDCLEKHFSPKELLLDSACGGSQNIPFFLNKPRSNDKEICNVDAAIIKGGKIKIIIEIEESSRTPTQICGKLLTSILAKYYIHGNQKNEVSLPIENALFIQILKKFSQRRSKKKDQADRIKSGFEESRVTCSTNTIRSYLLFWEDDLGDDCSPLIEEIKKYL